MKKVVIILVLFLFLTGKVYADEYSLISEYISVYTEEIEGILDYDLIGETMPEFSVEDFVSKTVKGENVFDFQGLWERFKEIILKEIRWISGSLAVVILLSNLLLGIGLMNKKDEDRTVVKVAAIQGNVNMDAAGSAIYELMEVYGDMTREAAEEGADIVVWPESIFPFKLNRYSILQEFVSSLAVECNVTLIVGALYGDADGKTYNTLYMVTPDGSISDNLYHKRHLVPFGEYVPMRKVFMTLIPPLAELSALDDDLSPGDETALFDTKWGKLGGLICFDSIYEELTRASVRDGANLMMLPSNDSWWFTTSVETYQNETQAMLRAIESGRYLVRAGNTGISSIITEHGEHKAWLAPETKGIAISEVEMCTHTTLYARVGNLLVYLCIAFVLILYPLDFLIEKRKKQI